MAASATSTTRPALQPVWRERTEFLDLDRDACAALREFWPLLEPALPDMLTAFYEKLSRHAETAALIDSPQKVSRLKKAQLEHWKALFSGNFDGTYFERVRRIGKAHERVGLAPRWYMAGYALMLGRIHAVAIRKKSRKPDDLIRLMSAIDKAVMLDAELAVSIYIEEASANHQRRLSEIASEFTLTIGTVADAVAREAETVHSLANTVADGSGRTRERSVAVAGSASETSDSIQSTAAAAEEMAASVSEISQQITRAASLARRAVTTAEDSNSKVVGLADAAERIGDVVKLIQDIARQTNLLALNASIEAARAGNAGLGFAVVANEVKALARQTAEATAEISSQVKEIRGSVTETVASLQTIGEVIAEMEQSSTAIAATVDEQDGAAREIAMTIARVASNAGSVSSAIADVSESAADSAAASDRLNISANDLVEHGRNLRQSVTSLADRLRQSA